MIWRRFDLYPNLQSESAIARATESKPNTEAVEFHLQFSLNRNIERELETGAVLLCLFPLFRITLFHIYIFAYSALFIEMFS